MQQRFFGSNSNTYSDATNKVLTETMRLRSEKKLLRAIAYFEKSSLYNEFKVTDDTHESIQLLLLRFMTFHLSQNNFEKAYHYLTTFGFNLQSPLVALAHGIYAFTVMNDRQAISLLSKAVEHESPAINLIALLFRSVTHLRMHDQIAASVDFEKIVELGKQVSASAIGIENISFYAAMHISKLELTDFTSIAEPSIKQNLENLCISIIAGAHRNVDPQQQLIKVMELFNHEEVEFVPLYLQEQLVCVLADMKLDNSVKFTLKHAENVKDFIKHVITRCGTSKLKQSLIWKAGIPSRYLLSQVYYYNRNLFGSASIESGRLKALMEMLDVEIQNNHGLIHGFPQNELVDSKFMELLRLHFASISFAINQQGRWMGEIKSDMDLAEESYRLSVNEVLLLEDRIRHAQKANVHFPKNVDYFINELRLNNHSHSLGEENLINFHHRNNLADLAKFAQNNPFHGSCQLEYVRTLRAIINVDINRKPLHFTFTMRPINCVDNEAADFDDVIEEAKKAVFITPSCSASHAELAAAYHLKSLENTYSENSALDFMQQAIEEYKLALLLASDADKLNIQEHLDALYLEIAKTEYQRGKTIYRTTTSVNDLPSSSMRLIQGENKWMIEKPPTAHKAFESFEQAKKWCSFVKSPKAEHFANYVTVCCDLYTAETTLDEQIEKLKNALVAHPEDVILPHSLSALYLRKGDIMAAKEVLSHVLYDVKLTSAIYTHMIDLIIPELHLRPIYKFLLGFDCSFECEQFLVESYQLSIPDRHIDAFFEALASAKSPIIFDADRHLRGDGRRKQKLFNNVIRISNPLLKIGILVQALSSPELNTMASAFFHAKFGPTLPSFNSLTGLSILNSVLAELEEELFAIKAAIRNSSVDNPVIATPQLRALILKDKYFRQQLTAYCKKHSSDIKSDEKSRDVESLLLKSVGLSPDIIRENESALGRHSFLASNSMSNPFANGEEYTYREDLTL